ncbi:MAG: hypothetical protein WCK90_05175 [archaeon]
MDKKLILVSLVFLLLATFIVLLLYQDHVKVTANVIKNETVQEIPEDLEVSVGKSFVLKLGQSASINAAGLHIHFLNITEDSRCPINATCIQAGHATAEIEFKKTGGKSAIVRLSNANSNETSTTAELFLYKLKLQDISPYPILNETIPLSNYNITLMITR